jgi:metallo-beta-lactamase class B
MKSRSTYRVTLGLFWLLLIGIPAAAVQQVNRHDPNASGEARLKAGTTPVTPFKVIGNIYYVGTVRVTSFLITTPEGNILIDTGYEQMAPLVRDSIERLGFKLTDVKLLLTSHGHNDHVGGHAFIQKLSGAKILVSEADAPAVTTGGRGNGPAVVKIDGFVRDKQEVSLGGVKLTAHLTPGHTKGCTTWTMTADDGGRKYNVVFVCSLSINDARLLGDPAYPTRATDFRKSIDIFKNFPCDIFLASHGFFFELERKIGDMARNPSVNPWIDPVGYKDYLSQMENEYTDQLRREREGK